MKYLSRTALALLMMVVSTIVVPQFVGALSNVAPDPADYTAGNNVTLLVSRAGPSNGLEAPISDVVVYLNNPSGVIRISNGADQCGKPPDTNTSGNTTFSFYNGRTPTSFIRSIASTSMNCGDYDVPVSGINPVQVGSQTFYPVFVRAQYVDSYLGGANSFKVRIAAGGGIVSYFAGGDNRFTIQDRYGDDGDFSDFNLKFGTDCSITSNITANLSWRDDDQGSPLVGSNFGAELYEITPSGARSLVIGKSGFTYTGNAGNGNRPYTFKAYHKYEWIWYDINKTNGIQFDLPFDSIFYNVGCFNFGLRPNAPSTASTSVVAGQPVVFNNFTVSKTGTNSPATAYAVKYFQVPPGSGFNQSVGMIDNASNCDPRYATSVCATTPHTGSYAFTSATTNLDSQIPLATRTIATTGMAVGTRICMILAVDPPTQNSTPRDRWSAPRCVVVAKSPYVTVRNGDVWAGGSFKAVSAACPINTANETVTGQFNTYPAAGTYGSYGEYGVFALGSITGFGSAGKPGASTNLNFKRPGGNFYTSTTGSVPSLTTHCLKDANDLYKMAGGANSDLTIGPTFTVNAGTNGRLYSPGNLTINGGTVGTPGAARRAVIYVNGNVTINGNIIVSNPSGDISTLNSFVLIATGNITVNGTVTRLDGYYQSYGTFKTCTQAPDAGMNITSCNQPLAINGALNVGDLLLKRTAGNGDAASRNQPAETIVMRPDVFLGLYVQSAGNGQVRAVNETELPPRY